MADVFEGFGGVLAADVEEDFFAAPISFIVKHQPIFIRTEYVGLRPSFPISITWILLLDCVICRIEASGGWSVF